MGAMRRKVEELNPVLLTHQHKLGGKVRAVVIQNQHPPVVGRIGSGLWYEDPLQPLQRHRRGNPPIRGGGVAPLRDFSLALVPLRLNGFSRKDNERFYGATNGRNTLEDSDPLSSLWALDVYRALLS